MIKRDEGVMDRTGSCAGLGSMRGGVDTLARTPAKKALTEKKNGRDQGLSRQRVQEEERGICDAVASAGWISRGVCGGAAVGRREAGEHLFHRLIHADLLER